MPVQAARPGNACQEGLLNATPLKALRNACRVSNQSEDVGIGKEGSDSFKYPLAPAQGNQPVMNDGYAHLSKAYAAAAWGSV